MKQIRFLIILVIIVFLIGCSTKVQITDITGAKPGDVIEGIPFRTKTAFTLRIYKRLTDGSYKEVGVKHEELADMQSLYAFNYKSQLFSDHELVLAVNDDGTLQSMDLTTAQKIDDLSKIGTSVSSMADALAAFKKAEREREEAKAAGEEAAIAASEAATVTSEVARLAAEIAHKAADDKMDELRFGTVDLTDAEIAALQRSIRLLQIEANQKYRRAGLTPPYNISSYPEIDINP